MPRRASASLFTHEWGPFNTPFATVGYCQRHLAGPRRDQLPWRPPAHWPLLSRGSDSECVAPPFGEPWRIVLESAASLFAIEEAKSTVSYEFAAAGHGANCNESAATWRGHNERRSQPPAANGEKVALAVDNAAVRWLNEVTNNLESASAAVVNSCRREQGQLDVQVLTGAVFAALFELRRALIEDTPDSSIVVIQSRLSILIAGLYVGVPRFSVGEAITFEFAMSQQDLSSSG
ncbi:unnamed protein product, partial [Iphiclides podalirius]